MEGSSLAWPLPPLMAGDALWRRPRSRMIVYKIVANEEWAEAEAAGAFAGAAVDRADGFIHFSTAEQTRVTAPKWFAGPRYLPLAAVDAEPLGDGWRWDPSRGGAPFPLLYAVLPMSAVVWSRPLPL